MRPSKSISFRASDAELALEALDRLTARYGQSSPEDADVIVALGGDGFMLQTLNDVRPLNKPVYGMNRGTVGFLMNEYSEDDLPARLAEAEEAVINPLHMRAGSEVSGRNEIPVEFRRRSRPSSWQPDVLERSRIRARRIPVGRPGG